MSNTNTNTNTHTHTNTNTNTNKEYIMSNTNTNTNTHTNTNTNKETKMANPDADTNIRAWYCPICSEGVKESIRRREELIDVINNIKSSGPEKFQKMGLVGVFKKENQEDKMYFPNPSNKGFVDIGGRYFEMVKFFCKITEEYYKNKGKDPYSVSDSEFKDVLNKIRARAQKKYDTWKNALSVLWEEHKKTWLEYNPGVPEERYDPGGNQPIYTCPDCGHVYEYNKNIYFHGFGHKDHLGVTTSQIEEECNVEKWSVPTETIYIESYRRGNNDEINSDDDRMAEYNESKWETEWYPTNELLISEYEARQKEQKEFKKELERFLWLEKQYVRESLAKGEHELMRVIPWDIDLYE